MILEAVGSRPHRREFLGGIEASRFVGVGLLTHFVALPAPATFQPTDYFLVHRHDAGQQVRVARGGVAEVIMISSSLVTIMPSSSRP